MLQQAGQTAEDGCITVCLIACVRVLMRRFSEDDEDVGVGDVLDRALCLYQVS